MIRTFIVRYPGEASLTLIEDVGELSARDSLERVFAWCNSGSGSEHPKFIREGVRSLSVNDFVCVDGLWFQCASNGWNACNNAYVAEIEEAVKAYPKEQAWFALNDVMRARERR